MDAIWFSNTYPRRDWRLVIVNRRREIVRVLARVRRWGTRWYYICEPPALKFGWADSFDEARTAVEACFAGREAL